MISSSEAHSKTSNSYNRFDKVLKKLQMTSKESMEITNNCYKPRLMCMNNVCIVIFSKWNQHHEIEIKGQLWSPWKQIESNFRKAERRKINLSFRKSKNECIAFICQNPAVKSDGSIHLIIYQSLKAIHHQQNWKQEV